MYHRITEDIVIFLIFPKPSTYLFHWGRYIHQCLCSVRITGHDNKPIIGKEVAALETFFGEEVDPFIRAAY